MESWQPGEMLRGKGGDAENLNFFPGTVTVSPWRSAGVNTPMMSPASGLLHDFPAQLGAQAGSSHFFITLDVLENLGLPLVFAESRSAGKAGPSGGLVDVGLDLGRRRRNF